ncbi:MAG: T9SS type A sorting domain-containing protein, partial [Bacteroidota bacterium]|nr:T9SS type A sorting domain-containing protein [Bacteroidota bacterium]
GIIWLPNGETTSEIIIETAGIYSVTASNACGGFSDSTKAISLQTPSAWFGNDTIICLGGQIQFAIQDQQLSNYFWSTGETDTSIIVLEQGNYSLIVSNTCGGDTNNIFLTVHENTYAFATDTIFISNADTIIISGTDSALSEAEGYLWSTNETTPSITVSEPGTYYLTVSDTIGCKATDSIIVALIKYPASGVLPLQDVLIYPNPFSNELIISGLQGNEEIRVLDVLGREIQLYYLVKENRIQLSFRDEAFGLYFIHINRGKELKVVKVVKA